MPISCGCRRLKTQRVNVGNRTMGRLIAMTILSGEKIIHIRHQFLGG